MTTVASLAAAVTAVWWLRSSARLSLEPASRCSALALQLALLAVVPGPESIHWYPAVRTVLVASAVLAAGLGAATSGKLRFRGVRWVAIYMLIVFSSALVNADGVASFVRPLQVAFLFGIAIHVTAALEPTDVLRLFGEFAVGLLMITGLGAVLSPGDAFAQFSAPVIDRYLEAPSIGLSANAVAFTGLVVVVVGLSWRRRDLSSWSVAGIGVVAMVLTLKRASWLAAAVLALTWLALKARRRLAPVVAAGAVVMAVAVLVPQVRDLWDREQSRPQAQNIWSTRGAIFEASLDRFADSPVLGTGLGVGTSDLMIERGGRIESWNAHDELGTVLVSTGVLGAVTILAGHGLGIVWTVSVWRTSRDALPLAVAVAGLAMTPFFAVLSNPSYVSLPYLLVVFAAYPTHEIGVSRRGRRAARSSSGAAVDGEGA